MLEHKNRGAETYLWDTLALSFMHVGLLNSHHKSFLTLIIHLWMLIEIVVLFMQKVGTSCLMVQLSNLTAFSWITPFAGFWSYLYINWGEVHVQSGGLDKLVFTSSGSVPKDCLWHKCSCTCLELRVGFQHHLHSGRCLFAASCCRPW